MKVCTKCKVETPDSEMIQNGKGSWCKQCAKEYSQRFRGTLRGRAYNVYIGMIDRCYNPKATQYNKYGGSGIIVADEWLGEEGFNNFFKWWTEQPNSADFSYQLDKDIICNLKNIKPHIYSPDTCQFVSRSENQRNYSTLLSNNTSGYTGVTKNKDGIHWDFRLHREHSPNINRSGFRTAIEAAKSREALIISNDLNFKLEHVGSSIELHERPADFNYLYASSNYNSIRKAKGKFTGVVNLSDGTRKSIGTYLTEREAASKRNELIHSLNVSEFNTLSYLFGYGVITKEP